MAEPSDPSDPFDPSDLQRFLDAQDAAGTYATALAELRAGRKRSHWMWFVFPQLAGLGQSPVSRHYAITGLAQARAYLAHPVLGPRLHECAQALGELPVTDPVQVLGEVDALKLRSSLTLFLAADPQAADLRDVLDRFFAGEADPRTLSALGGV